MNLADINIVLVNTTHAGNIGATARAMKTMGLKNLVLAAPLAKFPSADATVRAAGADSVLANAVVVQSLAAAVANCSVVIGTGAEERRRSLQRLTARQGAEFIFQHAATEKIAIVFGTERSGMSNSELALCQRQIVIPTASEYTSLNLAAAVQVITYELFMAAWAAKQIAPPLRVAQDRLATTQELTDFYLHLEHTLIQLNFIRPAVDKKIMPRLQRLYNRSCLEMREINLLRGILNAAHTTPLA